MKLMAVVIILLCLCGCAHSAETSLPPPAVSTTEAPALSETNEQEIYKALIDMNTRDIAEAQRRYHIPGNDEPESMTMTREEGKRLFEQNEALAEKLRTEAEAAICA